MEVKSSELTKSRKKIELDKKLDSDMMLRGPLNPDTKVDTMTVGALELYSEHCVRNDAALASRLRQIVIEKRFSKLPGWAAGGEQKYETDIIRHAYRRHDRTVKFIVPWVNQYFPLKDKRVVEVGCGTGSSTAAFAKFVDHVGAYEISPDSVEGAKLRLEAHGLAHKTDINLVKADEIWARIAADSKYKPPDILLLFAVLEHQTLDERLETLAEAQRVVKPGGIIIICETPNRLVYFDNHTSRLPFFQMLPIELQAKVAAHSPRSDFRESMLRALENGGGRDGIHMYLMRWGQSVSFHEFDLAFENIDSRILSGGDHPNIMKLRPPEIHEELLRQYMESAGIKRHPAFSRYFIDMIIRV
ncbi:MAG: methyltransferase domain-containing protein [Pseudomonadota bacterium]